MKENRGETRRRKKGDSYIIKCLIFFSILVCCLMIQQESKGLLLDISIGKENYRLDEDVDITVQVKNGSEDIYIIPMLFIPEDYYLRFVINKQNGEEVRFIGPEIDWMESEIDLIRMFPGSFYGQEINIKQYYTLAAGDYILYAIYEVEKGRRKEKNIWYGKLISNKVTFKIESEEGINGLQLISKNRD